MPQELPIHTTRMLYLLKQSDMTAKEWCEQISVLPQNLSAIKKGTRAFTLDQITAACKLSNTSMDWVTGLTDTPTKIKGEQTLLEQMKAAVKRLEINL